MAIKIRDNRPTASKQADQARHKFRQQRLDLKNRTELQDAAWDPKTQAQKIQTLRAELKETQKAVLLLLQLIRPQIKEDQAEDSP